MHVKFSDSIDKNCSHRTHVRLLIETTQSPYAHLVRMLRTASIVFIYVLCYGDSRHCCQRAARALTAVSSWRKF